MLVTRQTTTPNQFLLAGGAVTWVLPVAVVRYRKPKYGILSPTPASGNMHVAPAAARHLLIGTRTLCWEMGHWPADLPPLPPPPPPTASGKSGGVVAFTTVVRISSHNNMWTSIPVKTCWRCLRTQACNWGALLVARSINMWVAAIRYGTADHRVLP